MDIDTLDKAYEEVQKLIESGYNLYSAYANFDNMLNNAVEGDDYEHIMYLNKICDTIKNVLHRRHMKEQGYYEDEYGYWKRGD